jgi:uncharacterized protein YkwD
MRFCRRRWLRLVGRVLPILALLLALRLSAQTAPPTAADARSLLHEAEELVDEGQMAEAVGRLQQVLAQAPQWLRPQGLLGVALQVLGKREEALKHYSALQAGILPSSEEERQLLGSYAAEIIWLVNQERLTRHLRPLKPHPLLSLLATRHSEAMRDQGFFAHEAPDPQQRTPADRFAALFGFRPPQIAENIATRRGSEYSLTLSNLQRTHAQLMASPGHRANILGREYTDLGVGLAVNGRGDYWLTEEFVRLRR